MIDRDHELPVKRQAELLGISRGSVYYHPNRSRGRAGADAPHRRTAPGTPFAGSRMLRDLLRLQASMSGADTSAR